MDDKIMSREKLEEHMDEHLVEKAPFQVPEPGRSLIVTWAPWVALISGVFSIIASIGLWTEADDLKRVTTYFNDNGELIRQTSSVGALYYIAAAVLIVQAVLMLRAFRGLQDRSKARGWNFLLYAILASMTYNVVFGLSSQGETGNFVLAFLTGLVGLYFLAQIKSYYRDDKPDRKKKTLVKKKLATKK